MNSREFIVKDPNTGKFAAFENVTDKFTTPFLTQSDFIKLMCTEAYEQEKYNLTKFFEYGHDSCGIYQMDYKEAIDKYKARSRHGTYEDERDFYPVDIVDGGSR